ncbi:MAG TPA: aromatic ring-hydroxylating dioxygenase subunit alpha [Ramlibacter sp.]|nr:aromatic ring-hydroxylating dioxygenase subunit alpha [Ramlibacter sp.]
MTFQTNDPYTLGAWLTIGPVTRLKAASQVRPYRATLLGAEVLAWADGSGNPVATAGGRSLQVQSAYGYLWVCPGGEPSRPLFAFPEYAQAGRRIVDCDGIGVRVSAPRMVENFLDMGHFPYVHASYLGEVPQTEVAPYEVSIDEVADEIWATDCRFFQPRTSKSATTGMEVKYRYRVMQPTSAILYKTAFPRPGEMDAIGLFVQPVGEESVIAYCLLAYFDDVTPQVDLISFQHTIFGQDKPILENQRPSRMPLRPGTEIPTRCDAMSVAYRRWLLAKGLRYGVIVD